MGYRREIDGLRALAVVPVIFFHAGFETFSGGFIGVDVFFVISGYLITTIITGELKEGKFSIANFYERRARRILPALFLVMLVCVPLAWLWLPATDLKNFAKSLYAVALFASNVLFALQSGYFDTAAEFKPLLHTWSLAVEEQFYLLFPLLLAFTWRFGQKRVVVLLVCIAAMSLAAAQWGSIFKPMISFYLLPTRAWELLIGSIAAIWHHQRRFENTGRGVQELGGLLGLALIASSIVMFDRQTPFPGLYALVPTVGTVLIILFVSNRTLSGRLIGNSAFVGVGLVSYSAYLWHQPLFAFCRHAGYCAGDASPLLALSLLTFGLAYLSWKYVERPFRDRNVVSKTAVVRFSLAGTLFFLSIGIVAHVNNGFEEPGPVFKAVPEEKIAADIIVIGDSHGDHLVSGLAMVTSAKVFNYTSPGCLPLRDVDRYDYRFLPGDCAKKMSGHLDQIIARDPSAYVVLSSMGPVYLDGTAFSEADKARVKGLGVELVSDRSVKDRWKVFEIGLTNTLRELSALQNARVVFAFDVPELGIEYGCQKKGKELDFGLFKLGDLTPKSNGLDCQAPRSLYDERNARYREMVQRVAAQFPNILLFDPVKYFCDSTRCTGIDSKYGFLYRDTDHLSPGGSLFYAESLLDYLKKHSGKPMPGG